jgi:phosphatidylinositol dimannoside acyltransferase
MLLRLGLGIADRIVSALPSRAAYALADLAGAAWHLVAPRRRRLVAANLARVCAATGRPTSGRAFDALVRSAFRNHARYYVELLRAPHYDPARISEMVDVPDWPSYERLLRGRPSILVTSHIGNFEPFGSFLAAHGLRALAPIEEIEPRELFDFLAARRGAGNVELVPLRNARSALTRRLRENGLVGIIGDRLLEGVGHPVTMFGHPTHVPLGPAMLAVTHGAGVLVGRCLRLGPDRFEARGTEMEPPDTGDRRADVASLTDAMAERFERDIGEAPEQWWGAFQPFWPDIRA